MANEIPCPNPTCAHAFTLAQLQASARLKCPRCGFELQGRGTAKRAPKVSVPAKPQAAIPVAPAVKRALPVKPQAAVPLATPVPVSPPPDVDLVEPAFAPASSFDPGPIHDDGPLVKTRHQRRSGKRLLGKIVTILMAFLVAAGLVGAAVYFLIYQGLLEEEGGFAALNRVAGQVYHGKVRNQKGAEEPAFKVTLPKSAWTLDSERKRQLGALSAWKNEQGDGWLAVAVKDYGMQKPRDAELVALAIEKLQGHFGDNLELAAKTEPAVVHGTGAQKLIFKGQLNVVLWTGECYLFFREGFAYWLFLAGPTLDDIEPLRETLLKDGGFAIVTDRKGWREQPAKTETLTASNGRFTLTAPEGIWEKHAQSAIEFESGLLYLLGRLKEKDNSKNAHLQVFTMDKQSDLKEALKAAKETLEKQKQEQNSNYKLVLASEEGGASADGAVEDLGGRPARIVDLKMLFNETPSRYYLLAVVNEPDHCYVFLCDCNWPSRQIWRQDFMEMLRSLRMQKAS